MRYSVNPVQTLTSRQTKASSGVVVIMLRPKHNRAMLAQKSEKLEVCQPTAALFYMPCLRSLGKLFKTLPLVLSVCAGKVN